LTVTDDLPTPPLPDATAITLVRESAVANGICASGLAEPRSDRSCDDSCWRSWSDIEPNTTWTSSTPSSRDTAAVTSWVMRSLSGHPGIVSLIRTPTTASWTTTSSTMPSSVMGLPISGSSTVARASSTCASVGTWGPFVAERHLDSRWRDRG
jgi:hypothetical protein